MKKKVLNFSTPAGACYKVDANGCIISKDTPGMPSGSWIFLGLTHVSKNVVIPFNKITEKFLEDFNPCWKNGNPQYTVLDLDHGTTRMWGNTKYHGVRKIWFE